MNYSIGEIKEKYWEYKEILEQVESGNYDLPYSISQLEGMRDIVRTLNGYGFHLMRRPN